MKNEKQKINGFELFIYFLVGTLLVWWAFLPKGEITDANLYWGASYQFVAIAGWIYALYLAKQWGGTKSVIGKSIYGFALGLLFQTIGQSIFSYYNLVLHVEIPYPSLADIGYFGSIPFYIYGIYNLSKASGVVVSLQSFQKKLQALLIPALMLIISYVSFLNHYEFDWSDPLRIFLDFGYPLGQAIYVSIAILTFVLSRNVLGGLMKKKVLFLLLALIVQYIADYNFLYQSIRLSWVNSGYGDLIYLLSYALMALALARLRVSLISEKQS